MGDTPYWFVCPVARRSTRPDPSGRSRSRLWPPGHDRIVRTGRTRPNRSRRRGQRTLDVAHEYRCSCGHVGWSTHIDMRNCPLAGDGDA